VRNTISGLSLSQNLVQTTLETPHPPPTTTDVHHEQSLLAAEPPHQEERFNRNGILKIHFKDSMEKKSLNPFFRSFSKVILISKLFS